MMKTNWTEQIEKIETLASSRSMTSSTATPAAICVQSHILALQGRELKRIGDEIEKLCEIIKPLVKLYVD